MSEITKSSSNKKLKIKDKKQKKRLVTTGSRQ